jgi:glycosyltransferase involved in cell wall biosynthesis
MYKGTDWVEHCFKDVSSKRPVECMILSNRPHAEIIEFKKTADIAVEQVGNLGGTGYGVNSLENVALGVPTVTEFTPEYSGFLRDHPFALATREALVDVLVDLIDNESKRRTLAFRGRQWVEQTHSYRAVFGRLLELYRQQGIIA